MTGTTISVDLALLLMISGNAAAWAKVFFDARKSKANGKDHSAIAPCGADPQMVADHIAILATHASEIEGLGRSLDLVRTENTQSHRDQEAKLDRILRNGHDKNHEDK
jgi:hypothetical protein